MVFIIDGVDHVDGKHVPFATKTPPSTPIERDETQGILDCWFCCYSVGFLASSQRGQNRSHTQNRIYCPVLIGGHNPDSRDQINQTSQRSAR